MKKRFRKWFHLFYCSVLAYRWAQMRPAYRPPATVGFNIQPVSYIVRGPPPPPPAGPQMKVCGSGNET